MDEENERDRWRTHKEIDFVTYQRCKKTDCSRWVKLGTDYCCTPCNFADSTMSGAKHEIHEHSSGCNERWEQRRG